MVKHKAEGRETSAKAGGSAPPMDYDRLVGAIGQAHDHARRHAVQAVNIALTLRNWLIGYYIVGYERHGSDRAQYGERLLETLSLDLRRRLGWGFGWRNLEMFHRFHLHYPISQSLIAKFGVALPYPPTVPFTPLDW